MEAGYQVKAEGKENNLLELIAADPAFNLSLEELQAAMEPSRYVGRAKEQTEAFLAKVVDPLLEERKELLGMKAEINV
jgi:adenylosuccinate lyase